MKILLNKSKLIKFIKNEKSLGFVPTMGSIHQGHISLIKKSNNQSNKTIVSIFINKPQFNRKIDYKKYPRTPKKDIKLLRKSKVDYLYIPNHREIYPKGTKHKISINKFESELCGKTRPGHFKAIVDVVERFVKIINPKRIYFGEKDFQQLLIIKDYFKKKYSQIKIIGCKTIREKKGLAYSSRNLLLNEDEKKIASKVYKLLLYNKRLLIKKKMTYNKIKDKIYNLKVNKIDYIKVFDTNKIIKTHKKKKKFKIFIAYYLGSTRLIDNI
jgi:pantoate--beta-alanine ligase